MKKIFRLALTAFLLIPWWVGAAQAEPKSPPPVKAQPQKEVIGIQDGSKVHLEYSLSDDKGKLIDTNKGKDPLIYTHGQKQIIPGLEKALSGMHVGENKRVTVPPEQAYGPINPKAVAEVPKERIPADALKVGAELVSQAKTGQVMPVRVKEVKEKTVVLDLNHPLAGKTLVFDVKVLNIESSKAK